MSALFVQNDDTTLRVWRGRTGQLLFSYGNGYGTSAIPAVADVDGDGHVEIVLPYTAGVNNWGGLRALGNSNWAPGRRLWNEPSYHATNILDDQTLPRSELPSWQAHNTYMAQVPITHSVCPECGDTGEAIDLTASYLRIGTTGCPTQVTYTARVGNGGGIGAPKGVKVRFSQVDGDTTTTLGEVLTSKPLAPGQYEDVSINASGASSFVQVVVIVDPDQTVADGKLSNNVHAVSLAPCSGYDDVPPHFVSLPPLDALVGTAWTYFPSASDADGDAVSFQVTNAPSGLVGPTALGSLTWVPTADEIGLQQVTIVASDGRGGKDVQTFLVDVKASPLGAPAGPPAVAGIALSVKSDKTSYGPGETAVLTTMLENQQAAGRTGTLRVEVQDSTGMTLAIAVAPQTVLFVKPETQSQSGSVAIGTLLPGVYKAVAIYDEGAAESQSVAEFAVVGAPALSLSVITDRSQYGAGETVRISGQLQNGSSNAVLGDVTPKLFVLDSSSSILGQQQFDSLDLAPSSQRIVQLLFDSGLHAPGAYRARLEVWQRGQMIGTSESQFSIVSSATRGLSMSGDVVCNPPKVLPGASFVLTGVMANVGNTTLAGLDVRLQVVDPITQEVVREQQSALDLAMGANGGAEATFSADGLAPKSYIGRLVVSLGGRTLSRQRQSCW